MEQMPAWIHAPDMRALLEAVDKQEMQALSPGLGLGAVQASGQKSRSQQRPAAALRRPPAPISSANAAIPARQASPWPPTPMRQEAPTAAERSLARQCLAWLLDIVLVVASLTTSVLAMIAVHAARGGEEPWFSQAPVQWMTTTSPFLTIGFVYAVFLVYGLLFRVVVGRTCGEALLGVHPRARRRGRQAAQQPAHG